MSRIFKLREILLVNYYVAHIERKQADLGGNNGTCRLVWEEVAQCY